MVATVDWGEPFVKACYHLEGDGPLALDCFETIGQVIASVATENIPNVRAIAQKLTRNLLHIHFMNNELLTPGAVYKMNLITLTISLLPA